MSRILTYREALREGLDEELARDPNVVLMGEEVAQYNGAYKVTEGLWEKWGDKRVVDTPISEAGFIGMGIGASMLGVRPVMELMFWSFHSVAFDQLVNNAACVRYMSGGLCNCPIVVRGPANGGTGVGATHSHIPEGLFAAFPGTEGLRSRHSLRRQGPDQSRHPRQRPGLFHGKHPALRQHRRSPGSGRRRSSSSRSEWPTSNAKARMFPSSPTAARSSKPWPPPKFSRANTASTAEVLDLRSIRPLDEEAILKTVMKTNRVVLVDESKPFGGVSAMVAMLIQEHAFDYLDAPVKRVCSIDAPAIYSPHIEHEQLPNPRRIVEKVLTLG